jgi:two-component system CheB/CheR fusion protein
MLIPYPGHIIAIGASAGGMEEINSFFDHTPVDGVSYIIIQHLSAGFKSSMAELLARHSKLKVQEAENGMEVMANQVYLVPNDKFMTINGGKLWLKPKENVKGPHLTINLFFTSLAEYAGKKAIAVILSGMGSDGTDGIKLIKQEGGMVLARNPETTEYGSMPAHAIATGMVDFVLEPEQMPVAIEDYIKQEAGLHPDSYDDEKVITAIIELIKETSPLDFSDYKRTTILRRTKRRAAHLNFTRLEDYLEFLKRTPEEAGSLAKEFLISVTAFFRDAGAFDFIENEVLPSITAGLAPRDELKIWVAGCATGEEAYSLAILIAEQLNGSPQDIKVKIFATDIDTAALAHAGKGLYSWEAVKHLSPRRLENFFLKEGSNYRIKPEIRKMLIFAQHDLVKNPPYCNMHLISCRNLLIYMTPALQKKIFDLLLFGLKKDSYLFLGTSENPAPIIKSLEVVNKKWKIYKSTKTERRVSFESFSMPVLQDVKRASRAAPRDGALNHTGNTLPDAMLANLADETDRLAVCIDRHNRVLASYGDPAKYFLQKYFTSDLDELLPKPLAIAFNTLSKSVLKTGKRGVINGIKFKNGAVVNLVNLSVSPVQVKNGEQGLLMVTFTEDKTGTRADTPQDTLFDEKIYLDQYTVNLEEELKLLKEDLRLAYEKLDATNENMQSFNEELISANEEMQSTNEEMQSTNEEMQSVNEELHTINADYQLKNKELVEINDDLNNYFRSNVNGQLFVNNRLMLMRFSPGTVKQINLRETDIGRPLSNISTNIKFETLINDINQVLKNGTVITKEIETNDGRWHQMMIMPYVLADHTNSGAVITFNDITELKAAQQELDKKNKSLLRINADLDHFIHVASHDLLAPLANIEGSINKMNSMAGAEPDMVEYLNIINLSVQQFRKLVTDIATIAKIESDMNVLEMVDIDVIISNVIWSLGDRIKKSAAVVHTDLEVNKIPFSKKNLRSIVYNLVSNAIKFKRDLPPEIYLSTKKDGDNVILTVQDNGTGIPKEKIDKIFDLYGRLIQDVEGHGIGLYLTRKIVDATGGRIEVESEPGMGTKFMIYLKA